ncbi:DNA cytosine methyltransferase [Brevibacillus reuszeri]|uniref:DNA cytosine methyltransferase n=1 Tax=Brevibacillus reuszeri TaxID=54915 RepID=UPI000CCC926C|nr:DNA cytosine methyltransferase [Brevibacillus reuszeri]
MNLIKRRTAKNSDRGIYLQDRELVQTVFSPGTNYKYVMDVKNRKIIILSSTNQKDNKVSKRAVKNGQKPVLDIRSKEALSAFKGCDYLQVSIYDDQVIVEGFVQEQEGLMSSIGSTIKEMFTSKNKPIADIRTLLKVRQVASAVFSKSQLKKAVGDSFEQLSFELFNEASTEIQSSSIRDIQSALQNLPIALKITSLFSASGILDLAFEQEGYDVVFALEKDKHASNTYEYNFKKKVTRADIREFDLRKMVKSPIMISGSPCQGLSNSNRYTNYLDNPNNLLIKKFIEAVKVNENCQIWMLENVPQLLSQGNSKFLNEIKEELGDFEVEADVLCAADYGSCQIRERAIVIGSKIGPIGFPNTTRQPDQYMTVEEAFQGLHNGIPNQLDVSEPEPLTVQRIEAVKPGGNVHDIPEDIRPKGVHSNNYRRLQWDSPSVTIVNPRKSMLLHPSENRILSVRECARLFGVPDDFRFIGNLNAKQQMIANAVPVELGRAIARVIKNAIMKWNLRNRNLQPLFNT